MVENRIITERHKTMSARSRNQRQLLSARHTNKMTSPSNESPKYKNTDASKFKKIVLFDSADEKDINMNDSSSSSNGSDVRPIITNSVSFGRSSRLSARSNRSSAGTSSSSNMTDSDHNPIRPQRSISTPAMSRSSRRSARSVSDSVSSPRPLSRARVSSRASFVSSEGLATPRHSSSRGLKRKDRLKLSRCESVESINSEDFFSPREAPPPLPQPLSPEMIALTEQSKLVWDQFSTHVKLIDDSTDLIARRPRKTFNSSGIFQQAMEDLYGSPEYWKSRGIMKLQNRVGAIAKFASKFIVGARKAKAMHQGKGEDESDEDDDLFFDYQPSKETVDNAQRGWRILRRHVQERAAERRMNQTTLTWDMLRHTLKGISNMQRARIDLYQRYGVLPIIKNDGTVVQENTMLSERARSAMSSKSKTITPSTTTRFSSASHTKSRTYAAIEGYSGAGTNLNASV